MIVAGATLGIALRNIRVLEILEVHLEILEVLGKTETCVIVILVEDTYRSIFNKICKE